jgi:hypothetical protein
MFPNLDGLISMEEEKLKNKKDHERKMACLGH